MASRAKAEAVSHEPLRRLEELAIDPDFERDAELKDIFCASLKEFDPESPMGQFVAGLPKKTYEQYTAIDYCLGIAKRMRGGMLGWGSKPFYRAAEETSKEIDSRDCMVPVDGFKEEFAANLLLQVDWVKQREAAKRS